MLATGTRALAAAVLVVCAQCQDAFTVDADCAEDATSLLQVYGPEHSTVPSVGETRRDSLRSSLPHVTLGQPSQQMQVAPVEDLQVLPPQPEELTKKVPQKPAPPPVTHPLSSQQWQGVGPAPAQFATHWENLGIVGTWLALNMPWALNYWQTLSFAMVINTLCMIGNVLVQVSPYPQAKRWEAKKDTGDSDAAPYVSICYCGWQWCFYGTFAWLVTGRSGFLILVKSNCLGALLGVHYTVAFYRNCCCDSSRASLFRYLKGVACLVSLQACGLMILRVEHALFLSGLVSSFCSFVGACSMLVTVPTVMHTKDAASINGGLVSAYFASAIAWCVCGYLLGDMLVMGPNVVSAISSALCIWLKLQYPGKGFAAMPSAAAIARKNAALAAHLQPAEYSKEPACLSRMQEESEEVPMRSGTGGTD